MNCACCKKEITGNYILVVQDVYHANCFKCAVCTLVLQDVYYFKNSEILCQEHYSIKYSSKCAGCGQYIYQEYYIDNSEKWHLPCWKFSKKYDLSLNLDINYEIFNYLLENLENFESKTSQQISRILVSFSNLDLQKTCYNVLIFLNFIETLLYSLFLMEIEAQKLTVETEFTQSTADMTFKIIEFIHVLSLKDLKSVEIHKISELVQSIKLVLVIGLKDAKRLQQGGSTDLFLQFIECLQGEVAFSREGEDSLDLDWHTKCRYCLKELSGECFGIASRKWHSSCLKCSTCHKNNEVCFINANNIYCGKHVKEEAVRLRHVSPLEQYNYLLLFALKRFCDLVNSNYPRKY